MRVSTNMIFDQGVRALQTQSAALLYTGQQIATRRKILTPADDPVASARALDVTQSRSVNKQFITNQGYAEDALDHLMKKKNQLFMLFRNFLIL